MTTHARPDTAGEVFASGGRMRGVPLRAGKSFPPGAGGGFSLFLASLPCRSSELSRPTKGITKLRRGRWKRSVRREDHKGSAVSGTGGTERRPASGGDRYLAGARASVPFALATLVLGISFGMLARSLGWGTLAPIAFSVLAFSGSAQFGVASVLGSGGGALTAFIAAVLLNARFGPMGVAVAPYLKGGPLRRALEGQAVIDASWALASRG